MMLRLLKFVASPELGLVSTLLFAGLYTWPLLTSGTPSSVFRFTFVAWCLHVVLIAATNLADRRIAVLEQSSDGGDNDSHV